jgi:hypothetical protein
VLRSETMSCEVGRTVDAQEIIPDHTLVCRLEDKLQITGLGVESIHGWGGQHRQFHCL